MFKSKFLEKITLYVMQHDLLMKFGTHHARKWDKMLYNDSEEAYMTGKHV